MEKTGKIHHYSNDVTLQNCLGSLKHLNCHKYTLCCVCVLMQLIVWDSQIFPQRETLFTSLQVFRIGIILEWPSSIQGIRCSFNHCLHQIFIQYVCIQRDKIQYEINVTVIVYCIRGTLINTGCAHSYRNITGLEPSLLIQIAHYIFSSQMYFNAI